MSRHLILCTPRKAADLKPFIEAREAFIAATPEGWKITDFEIKSGLVKSRDTACSYALHVEATDVLMWDNDVSAPADQIWQMVMSDADIVGAPYTTKEHPSRWVFTPLQDSKPGEDGLMPVYEIGTGLKRYRVSALREIAEAMTHIEYEPADGNIPGVRRFNFHFMGVVPTGPGKLGRWLSEDYGFDYLARTCGLRIWCDTRVQAKHWLQTLTAYPVERPPMPGIDPVVEAVKAPVELWDAEYLKAGVHPLHCADVLAGSYEVPIGSSSLTILDIGANIGAFCRWAMARWPYAMIHAYEPHPGNFKLLERTLGKLKAPIVPYNVAVLDKETTMPLYAGQYNCGEHSLFGAGGKHSGRVNVKVIDAATLPEADIIKMDTEGAELPILRQLSAAGKLAKVKAIMLEYHNAQDAIAIGALLTAKGFALHAKKAIAQHRGELKFVRPEAVIDMPVNGSASTGQEKETPHSR